MKRKVLTAVLLMVTLPTIAGSHFGYTNPSPGLMKSTSNSANFNTNTSASTAISQGGTGGRGGAGGSSNQQQGQSANNDQGQQQGQQQGQVNRDLVNVDLSNHSKTKVSAPEYPVNTAVAPALIAGGNDVCVGSFSAGGQGAAIGLSFGKTYKDNDCILRKDARLLHNMKEVPAAISLMCSKQSVRDAYARIGVDCFNPMNRFETIKSPSVITPSPVIRTEPVMGNRNPTFTESNS